MANPRRAAALTEEDLVARCLQGQASAWVEAYERNVDRLWRFVARLGVPPADTEDLIQEVFLVAHRKLHVFDGRVALGTWLLGIALRLVRNYRHRQWRRRLSRLVDLAPPASSADPERAAAVKQAVAEAHWALERMSERQRVVLLLYEMEGLEGPEIASVVGCSVNTVKSRLHKARAEFQRLLRQHSMRRGAP